MEYTTQNEMNLLEKLRLTLLVYNLVHKICQDMLPLVTGLKYFKLKSLETMLHVFPATFQNRGTLPHDLSPNLMTVTPFLPVHFLTQVTHDSTTVKV